MEEQDMMNKKQCKKGLSKSGLALLLNQVVLNIGVFVSVFIISIFYIVFNLDMDIDAMPEIIESPEVLYTAMIFSVLLAYIPIYIYMRKQGFTLGQQLGKTNVSPSFIFAALAICLGLSGLTTLFIVPIEGLFNHYGYTTLIDMGTSDTTYYYVSSFLYIVLIGPIMEELVYRGGILAGLRKYGDRFAIIISSLLFGVMHGNIAQFFFATLVGALLGYIYVKTNSLRISILIHVLNNLFALVLMDYLYPNLSEATVVWFDWTLTIALILIGAIVFFKCYKHISLNKGVVQLPISPYKGYFTRIPVILLFLYFIIMMYVSVTPIEG